MAKDTKGKPGGGKGLATARKAAAPKRDTAGVARKSGDRLALVRELITAWAEKLQTSEGKSGVAELARLIALEKELAESTDTVREIRVTWVEPSPAESSKSE